MSTSYIKIKEGTYKIKGKSASVAGTMFPMVKAFSKDKVGGFVLVDAFKIENFPGRNIKIRVKSPKSYEFVGESEFEKSIKYSGASVPGENEQQAIERIRERFDILDVMTEATMEGTVRALIVSGPPGVGKSYGVEEKLNEANIFDKISESKPKWEVCRGAMSAIGLYKKLFRMCNRGEILVLDDCDSILFDDVALNIMKAALDSSKRRFISWNTESRVLANEGIPDRFEFNGSVIMITNIKFDYVKSKKLQDHLKAVMSRCHYLDLTMDTVRDRMLRCKQIIADGEMLANYKFSPEKEQELIDFIWDGRDHLNEISLRMVTKIADLMKMSDNWEKLARATCMKRSSQPNT
jgi:hypothetical protein